jgi:truncated hemoglobin YjbI
MKAKDNIHGALCKIIVTHGKNYEGLNISALRGVHLGEPLFSSFADKQAIGRGARFCGHAGLTGDALSVTVYRYFAEPPKSMTFADVFPGKSGKRWETKYSKLAESFANVNKAAMEKGMSAVRREHPGINARGYDAMAHAAARAPEVLTRFEETVKDVAIDRNLLSYFASSKRGRSANGAGVNVKVPRSMSFVSASKRKENANLANAMKKLNIRR